MAIGGMIVGKNFVTLMVNGRTHTINSDHVNYEKIRDAIREKDMDLVESLVDVAKSVVDYGGGKITISNGQVFYGNHTVRGAVVNRILDMMKEGFDVDPMVLFLENLLQNPSKRAVDELYGFLESTALPITEDGHFLAYKKVKEDYKDVYTGKMDNSVGQVLEMPRNGVDEDKDRTCSAGLHFCSLGYLSQYYSGKGKVMIVKINPADVVAIPSDYNNAKGRACRYEIIGEHTSEYEEAFDKPVWNDKHFEESEDNWLDDEETDSDYSDEDLDDAYNEGYEAGAWDAEQGNRYDNESDYEITVVREVYKNGYSKGWIAGEKQAKKPESPTVKNGALVGYNQGRKDASAGVRYNDNPAAHAIVVSDLNAYQAAYNKGWNSIKLGK